MPYLHSAPFNPEIHRRESRRMLNRDYAAAGAYFVTIRSGDSITRFGEIENREMKLNQYGEIVRDEWNKLPAHFPHVRLDEFVIMPDHVHAIIVILAPNHAKQNGKYDVGAGLPRPYISVVDDRKKQPPLGAIVAYLKYQATRRINILRGRPGERVFQRDFHDHVIRKGELRPIREYIRANPVAGDGQPCMLRLITS